MKELLPLLEEMAASLGTTVEHLWGIMLSQAPISAATDFVQYGLIIGITIWWAKVSGKLFDDRDHPGYVITWGLIIFFNIIVFFCFPNTVTKLVNPEYWATMEILDKIAPSE